MIKEELVKALNEQIALEGYSSNAYLAMASWCDVKGLIGSADFFYAQSDEERMHMLKLVHYVNESGYCATIGEIKQPNHTYSSLLDVMTISLKQEQTVTESINNLVELSFSLKDHATYQFLQWYVSEQHEEESLFNSIIDVIKLGGEENNLLIIDQEISRIRNRKSAHTTE